MKALKIIGIVFIVLVVGLFIFSKSMGVRPLSFGMHQSIYQSDGIAVGGYDAVAYHQDSAAIKGDAQYSTKWQEIDWHFSSAENLALFKMTPEKFAPIGGGYCAFAVSKGFTAPSDGKYWKLVDGDLLLFSNEDVMKESEAGMENISKEAKSKFK